LLGAVLRHHLLDVLGQVFRTHGKRGERRHSGFRRRVVKGFRAELLLQERADPHLPYTLDVTWSGSERDAVQKLQESGVGIKSLVQAGFRRLPGGTSSPFLQRAVRSWKLANQEQAAKPKHNVPMISRTALTPRTTATPPVEQHT